ncbi:LOW QUALITY PROTEIN: 82 kDa gametocyte antigen, related [Eimeria mitis]|uniref:82 kDa gametocyte antigen, related n=1 Tax=Eimeria mitis TaxID=44415 RepID=U6K1V0_9EIME|nr:LOW QUALITY PROTEIN: 82 kDa gametocyte antigen, related [Eimeria mitis]CDJ30916.1 82 kDa gametocyte antigen, related [Eimeria mitis]
MARAAALAGVFALAAVGGSSALPPVLEGSTGTPMTWTEGSMETPDVSVGAMSTGRSGSAVRMMDTAATPEAPQQQPQQPQQQQPTPMQEAVLEAVDTAADAVRQIVTRVRERLAGGVTMPTAGEAGVTRPGSMAAAAAAAAAGPVAALRGVTNDFLREIMIQEAVLETLWAVVRDAQENPWMMNEQETLHTTTSEAVQGFLTRMHDRLRATGFTEEEVMRLLPRSRSCSSNTAGGLFETCTDPTTPARNLGKKGGYYGYGYPATYHYGYSYPYYSYTYAYPMYVQPMAYPAYYGYSWGPSYYYGKHGKHRRLGQEESFLPPTLTAAGTAAAVLRAAAAEAEMPAAAAPTDMFLPPEAATPMGMRNPLFGLEEGVPGRSLYTSWSSPYTRWPSYYSSPYYYSTPYYSRSWYSYPYTPAYSYSYPYTPAYSYSYPYTPAYSYGYRYTPSYSYSYPYYYRRLEVPDLGVPMHQQQQQQQQQETTSTAVPAERMSTASTRTTPSSSSSSNSSSSSSLRRVGDRYEQMTPSSTYFTPSNETPATNTVYTPEHAVVEEQTLWETYN